jgi:hypothetical protein
MKQIKNIHISHMADFLIWMICDLLVAALFPIINKKAGWIQDETQAIIFGLTITAALISAEVFFHLKKMIEADEIRFKLWDTIEIIDNKLSMIRKCYHFICENQDVTPDLFQKYFEDRIEVLHKSINDTSKTQELMIDQRHFSHTKIALDCFHNEPEDIFRAVHIFKDNEFFLHGYPQEYSHEITKKLKGKKIQQVKRLLIYMDDAELNLPSSLLIIKSHEETKNYIYKIASYAEYIEVINQELTSKYPDFGIYGSKYLYRAEVSEKDYIRGIWTKEKGTIMKYIDIFDKFFESGWAHSAKDLGVEFSKAEGTNLFSL